MTRILLAISFVLLAAAGLAQTNGSAASGFAYPFNGRLIPLNSDGNFLPTGDPTVPLTLAQKPTLSPEKALIHRSYWHVDVKRLPRLTVEHLSALLGKPGCTLEENDHCILVKLTNNEGILSAIRTCLTEDDATLDNQINLQRESAGHIRYVPSAGTDRRPRDLVLVRYDLFDLYGQLLVDSPVGGEAANVVGYLATKAGAFVVFDTRLTGDPKHELELVGGGLDNAVFPNILRVHAESSRTTHGARVIVEAAANSEVGEDMLKVLDQLRRSIEDRSPQRPLPTSGEKRDLMQGNLLAGLLPPGAIRLELRDLSGAAIAQTDVGSDAVGILDVPGQYIPESGVQLFTLVVHHPWGRDVIRPVVIGER